MRRAASGVGICPSASHHVGMYRPLLDRMSRPGNESRGTFVAKANLLQLTNDAVRLRVTRTRRTAAWLALPVLATAAGTKSLLKLNDGLAAANLLTRHARCSSDKKSSTGLHDIDIQLCVSGSGFPDVSVACVRFVFQVSLSIPQKQVTSV